jgi:hypothetical protein
LFTCASRIADDQVNVWKKHAAKEGKIDLFFELESNTHRDAECQFSEAE